MPLNNSAFSSFPINNLPDHQLDHLKSDQILKLHAWIHSRLSLNNDQLTAIVTGHPPILSYDIEKRLEPAIAFYEDALHVCVEDTDDNTKDDGNCNTTDDIVRDKLILLLCKSPQLLEYNVKKRLTPRLERVRATLGQQMDIDEDTLKMIATKTDSRFDEWLYNSSSSSSRGNSVRRNDIYEHQEDENRQPHSYIVLSNLQSGSNIGNILRSASIFGCKELIVVGQKRYRLTGDHGSRFDLKRHHVYSHEEAKIYLKSKGVRIYGVEIIEGAQPILQYDQETGITKFPFNRQYKGGAAFLMGNEGEGLSQKQMEICDEFIFIPQTRGGSVVGSGSSSLNVACAATVILQAYCLWAGYPIAQRYGEKFVASTAANNSKA